MPIWSVVAILLLAGSVVFADTYTVSNLNDAGPGSLRDAIVAANTRPGSNIIFAPGLAGQTILLGSDLPGIFAAGTVVDGDIDGNQTPDILLDGGNVAEAGLTCRGAGFAIRHVAVCHTTWAGIAVVGPQANGTVQGNTIHDLSGSAIYVGGAAAPLSIDGNTILNVAKGAVYLEGGAGPVNITHNTARNVGYGIFSYQCPQVNVRQNEFRQLTLYYGLSIHQASGCAIEGNQMDGGPYAGIWLTTVPNATVSGNTITGGACTYGAQIGVTRSSTNVTVADNILDGSGASGIDVREGSSASVTGNQIAAATWVGVLAAGATVTVSHNTIRSCGGSGVDLRGGATGSVSGNTVSGSKNGDSGISVSGIAPETSDVTVEGNTVRGCGWTAINFRAVAGGAVRGNTVQDCYLGICVTCRSTDVTVENNEIQDTVGYGIVSRSYYDPSLVTEEVTSDIKGNRITNVGWAGINVWGVTTSVSGNTITGVRGTGVYVGSAESAEVTGNTVVSPDGDGVKVVSCESAAIRSNHVSDSGDVGLWASGVATADISNNTVERTYQSGVQIESSGGSVVGNRITDADFGVNLGGATGVEVRDNTITGGRVGVCSKCLSTGVVVQGNTIRGVGAGVISVSYYIPSVPEDPLTVSICDNTVEFVGAEGILTRGTEATVTGNHVSATGGAGITCAGGATAEVTDNTVTDTGGSGIDVQNITAGPITVSGNDVTEVIGTGIYVGSSPAAAVTARDNSVADVGANGLEVRSCGDATVSGNTVQRYGVVGLAAVFDPTALVEDNEVSWGSGSSGIWLAGVDATVRGNTVTAAGWGGINACCYLSRALIEGNTVTGCTNGIGVHGGCVAQVRDNTVYGNHTGIAVAWPGSSATALISRNRTHDNNDCGIDLETNSVTPNDGARTPGRPNELIDFPEIVGVDKSGGSLVLHCTAPPNTTVEVFQSDGDASGYGEGKTFLRAIEVDETGEFDLPVSSGELPITMTASDLEAGITSEFSSWKLPVVADAGEDQTVEQASSAGTTVTLDASASVGSTGELTYTWREGEDILAGPTTEAQVDVTLNLGGHEIELTVQDGTGATSTDTVSVTVADTTAPNLTAPPAARAEQSSAAGTEVPLGEATVSDICDTDVTVTNDAPEVFPLGDTVVTWTAVDDSGNETTATQTVTVVDTTPPSITAPEGVSAEQATAAGTAVALGAPTVADICDASPDITNDAPAVFPLGDTTVTWTATDASGNSATATQTVTIVDTTPPSLTAPATVAAEQASADGAAVNLGAPTVSDICDASPDVTNDAPAVFPLGPTLVTWTATDDSGNQAVAYQTVLVVDTTAPDFTLTQLQTTLWPPNHQMVLCATVSDVRDTCDAAPIVDIVVTANEPIDDPSAGPNADWQVVHNGGVWEIWLRAERAGSLSGRDYVINATVMDASGNQTIKGCIVTVPHDQKTR